MVIVVVGGYLMEQNNHNNTNLPIFLVQYQLKKAAKKQIHCIRLYFEVSDIFGVLVNKVLGIAFAC